MREEVRLKRIVPNRWLALRHGYSVAPSPVVILPSSQIRGLRVGDVRPPQRCVIRSVLRQEFPGVEDSPGSPERRNEHGCLRFTPSTTRMFREERRRGLRAPAAGSDAAGTSDVRDNSRSTWQGLPRPEPAAPARFGLLSEEIGEVQFCREAESVHGRLLAARRGAIATGSGVVLT